MKNIIPLFFCWSLFPLVTGSNA